MAKLDVSGSFNTGGYVPQTYVVISVCSEDGSPKLLNFTKHNPNQGPANISVVLSDMFGSLEVQLKIVEFVSTPKFSMETGFYGFRVELLKDIGETKLEDTYPLTLGIVIDDGTDRGQALAWRHDVLARPVWSI